MACSFFKDTVTVLRAPLRESRGAMVPDWENAERIPLSRVQVTPASTVQDRDGRVVNVSDRFTLRAGYEADIEAGDRVEWDGRTFEVDGDVFHTQSPTGRASSTRCTLAFWEG